MEWIFGGIAAIAGWLFGLWQNDQERKRGIEEGARAAFDFEHAFRVYHQRDKDRLEEIFSDLDWTNPARIGKAASTAANVYADIVRMDTLEDCSRGYVPPASREVWQQTHGVEMPPVTAREGYLLAVQEVIAGVRFFVASIINEEKASEVERELDDTQRHRPDVEYGGSLSDLPYEPNAKHLGQLISRRMYTI